MRVLCTLYMQIRVISMPEINSHSTTGCTLDDLMCVCVNLKIFKTNYYFFVHNELHAHTNIHTHRRFEWATKRLKLILYGNFEPILRGNRLTALQAKEKPSKPRDFVIDSYLLLIIIFTLRTKNQFHSIRFISFSFRWLSRLSRFSISFFGAEQSNHLS